MTKNLRSTRIWIMSLLLLMGSLPMFGQVYTIGTGTSSTGGAYGTVSPVNNYYESYHMQILYKASELVAEGMTAAGFLDSLAWNVNGAPTYSLPNYTIKIKHTSATAVGTSLETGDFTTVYTASSFSPASSSWNWLVFSTPFFWNGSDNILIDVCYGVATNWSSTGTAYYTSTSYNSVFWQDQDDATLCGSPNSDAQTTTYRPNVKFGYTEAEDCVGTPVAGTIAGIDSICGSTAFDLTTSGGTMAAGLNYQWQSSPSGAGTWTSIAGATGSGYSSSAGISESTDYRLIITCTESGLSDTSDVYTVVKKDASECYCVPYSTGYTYGCSSWRIDNFSTTGGISNISNLNSNCSSGMYGDFTSMSASQYQGSTVNYDIKLEYPSGSYSGKVKMWIDWNQDGVFSSAEVVYNNASAASGTSLTGTFEVPSTALEGTTRIRIKTQMYNTITSECAFSTYDYNEVEDYTFEVVVPDPCEDATFTDITLSGPTGVCSGVEPFTITSEGTPIASGLTKVWESAPAGSGDWTTVTGASMSYLSVASITEATDYRYTVTCVATGESVVSDVWTVELNPPTECYCDIDYMYGCSGYIQVDDFYTTGGISDISNLGTGCAGSTGYGDYTDMVLSAYQGTMVNYNIELMNPYGSLKMWVDWNQDGDFSDSGELMYTSSSTAYSASSVSGSFEIPYDAPAGNTGIRIRTFAYDYAYDYYDACYDAYYGETEDYTLEVVVPDPCDEVPFTGLTIEGPETICAANAFTITSDGTPIASGLTRIWQKKTTGGSWTTISGATSLNYTASTGIAEATEFRYIVVCTITGESDTSNVLSITMNPPTECYCEAEFYGAWAMDTYTWNDYKIKDFIINGQTDTLFSLNTPFPFDGDSDGDLGGYTDYTSDTSLNIPDLVQTGTYTGQVKVRYASPYVIDRIWIDYDDDGVFGSTDVIHTSTTSYPAHSSGSPDNFSFTIPADANPGLHRMRVRAIYLYSSPLPIDPCYTYQYGQTQDYMVDIQELKPCAEVIFPDSVGATSTPPNVCGTGDITLKLTSPMPLADGITYQWKSSDTETGTYTNVGAELSAFAGPTLTITGVSTDKYYRCYVLCDGEAILISDAVYVQSVDLESVVLTTEDGQTCGPGPVTLTGSSTDGSVFWYLEAEGGSPVWMGDEYVTPSLTVTDTFYASGGAFGASNGTVGDGSSATYYYTPGLFAPYYGLKTMQYMYTADQLHEAGLTMAGDIESVAFNLATLPSVPLLNYTIKMKTVTTAPPMTWQSSGWTTVYTNPSFAPDATGWVTFPFDAPFAWNGTDNIIFEICFQPDAGSSSLWTLTGGTHKYTTKSGQVLYYFPYTSTSVCGTYGYTSTELPNAQFYIPGCETDRVPVVAHVRPVPAPINIGPDETICKDADNGLTLDAGEQPATYTFLWDNGTMEQTRRITESGTYYVEVANEYGCPVYDTVTKNLLDIPMVELGDDTTVCEGGFVTLDAGPDGTNYYWSTGATTRTIDVIAGGEYTVLVANANDCISLDTINVTVSGTMPSVASIIVTNTGLYTFSFEPLLPEHIVSYEWDFGDGSPVSTSENPTHTYATSGSYNVTLTVKSECGEVVYVTTAHIVGVSNVNADDKSVTLYPNPAKDIAVIESRNLKMKSVIVTNVLGQVMYQADAAAADKHQLELSRYASGIYTVRIDTDKGVIVRKFEIVK